MSVTNKALFVIERNLDRDLTLDQIAKRCDVSRFHLAHAFGESTGHSVLAYLRGRRLTEAARALVTGSNNILDLALNSGYASHEAFSRAFKAQFGNTPEEVRKSGSIEALKLVDPIRHMESKAMKLKQPSVEKAGELLFVGVSAHVSYKNMQTIAGQWQRFMTGPYGSISSKLAEPPVGIAISSNEQGIDYVCAAGITKFDKTPNGCVEVTLQPATYLVFAHDDHITRIRETYEAIWNDWFPRNDKVPAEAPSFERHNASFDPRTGNGGVTIWIPICT